MGLFKRLGSFASSLLGGQSPKSQSAHHVVGRKKESHHGLPTGLAKRRGTFAPTSDEGGRLRESGAQTTEEQRRHAEQAAMTSEMPAEQGRREVIDTDSPQGRFLNGEVTNVISSNVNWIQYDLGNELLYVQFRNLAVYVYYSVSRAEALDFFVAPSPGGWVWDHLRVRGTAFGYKHDYAFLSWSGSGYEPKYMSDEGYAAQHAAIPPSGEPPASWKAGSGPYKDLPWYNKSPGKESEPHQLPVAKVFDGATGGIFKST